MSLATPEAPDARGLDVGTDASLKRAGFGANAAAQARFASRVTGRMYSRAELATRDSVLYSAAAGLCLVGALARGLTGDPWAATVAGLAGLAHAGLAAWSARRQRARSMRAGEPDVAACYRDGDTLVPRLEPGETLVWSRKADGPTRGTVRKLGGTLQALWGLLLAGLPIATAGGTPGLGPFVMLVLATSLGAAMFGRGIRALFATHWVEEIALTDRRLVAMAAPGAARSILLEGLRHRPVVVARDGGRASIAIDVRPLDSVAPVQMMALYGFDDVSDDEARALAGSVMDARLGRIRASLVVD